MIPFKDKFKRISKIDAEWEKNILVVQDQSDFDFDKTVDKRFRPDYIHYNYKNWIRVGHKDFLEYLKEIPNEEIYEKVDLICRIDNIPHSLTKEPVWIQVPDYAFAYFKVYNL